MSRCGRPKCPARRFARVPLPEAAGPSMAMIIVRPPGQSSNAAPSPRISGTKVGKLVAIDRAVVDRSPARAVASPSTRNAMAMRWSRWVAIVPPPAHRPPPPSTIEVVALDPVRRRRRRARPVRDGGEPVRFLDPQFVQAAHPRRRPRAKAAATARIGYSSIIDGARSGGTSTPVERLVAHAQIGDRLAAVLALVQALDVGPHLERASRGARCAAGSASRPRS